MIRRSVHVVVALTCLLITAGCSLRALQTGSQQDEDFGVEYVPDPGGNLATPSPLQDILPPPKPAPLLSPEQAQSHLDFTLLFAQCPSLVDFKGVRLTKEVFPDGEVGEILTQVIYSFQVQEIKLVEHPANPDEPLRAPAVAQQIAIGQETGWLLENWVPGRNEIWWQKGKINLALWADKSIPIATLIRMAECVQPASQEPVTNAK